MKTLNLTVLYKPIPSNYSPALAYSIKLCLTRMSQPWHKRLKIWDSNVVRWSRIGFTRMYDLPVDDRFKFKDFVSQKDFLILKFK